jgi:molybdate transport system substrate-binding protein
MNLFKKTCVVFPSILLLLLPILFTAGCSGTTSSFELNVSAAASLTDVLKDVNDLYMQSQKNATITVNFAASGTLQKQIEQGAPADVFISAGAAQMDTLQKEQLIVDETRKDLLNNKVVLIVPTDSTLKIASFTDLTGDAVKKIAIGDPKFVPAGTYAQQAFGLLNITDQVNSKLILGADVRQVLAYVESGNVDAGIVFATDAAISDRVKIAASAPAEINSKIIYPVAIIKGSQKTEAAGAYISFLFSREAQAIFEKYGFSPASK